jgi:hypothetical protein
MLHSAMRTGTSSGAFISGAKRHLTEHADPDQIDAHFPPDVLAGDGSMVGYYEILPYAKPVEFTLGAQTWLLDDQHCVRANRSCQEAELSFFELSPSAQHSGISSEPALCIRYAYDTGQIEPLSAFGGKDGRWSGQDFVDALRRSPDHSMANPAGVPFLQGRTIFRLPHSSADLESTILRAHVRNKIQKVRVSQ